MQDKIYFRSRAIGKLSSESLKELRNKIIEIVSGRKKINEEIAILSSKLEQTEVDLTWIDWFPAKFLFKKLVSEKKQSIAYYESLIDKKNREYDNYTIELEISIDQRVDAIFGELSDSFTKLSKSQKIWDVTSSEKIDKFVARTNASDSIERKLVNFKINKNPTIVCDYKPLYFENANGGDIQIFPQFLLIENDNDFALIDLLDIDIKFSFIRFIEDEDVPSDSEIVGEVWAKSNKDGSRDLRFSNNYQIPVAAYGELHITSNSGLNEVYMFSDLEAAKKFKNVFEEYKNAFLTNK